MHDIYIVSLILKDSTALHKLYAYGNHSPIRIKTILGYKSETSWTNAQRTNLVKDNSWNYLLMQRMAWVIDNLIFLGTCNRCFIVHALFGCIHWNFHKPSTISEDRAFSKIGLCFPWWSIRMQFCYERRHREWPVYQPAVDIQFQCRAASSAGIVPFTWKDLFQSVSSGVSLHKMIRFYNLIFFSWRKCWKWT